MREEINVEGLPITQNIPAQFSIRYQIPSPANRCNILFVVFTPDDITVKFAVPGSHEHLDPDLYGGPQFDGDRSEFWAQTYGDALDEYVRPVIEDRMLAVYHDGRSSLVCDVKQFLKNNQLAYCRYESWSFPIQEFRIESMG
ncbi:MAG: hypothetical protein R3C01_17320 [Planctomycetaceae bacterium]